MNPFIESLKTKLQERREDQEAHLADLEEEEVATHEYARGCLDTYTEILSLISETE